MPDNFDSALRGILLDISAMETIIKSLEKTDELSALVERQQAQLDALRGMFSELMVSFADLRRDLLGK